MKDVCFCYKFMKITKFMKIWLKNVDTSQLYFTKNIFKIIVPMVALSTWVNFVSLYKHVPNLLLKKPIKLTKKKFDVIFPITLLKKLHGQFIY
jgi:hypothetical protein